MILDILFDAISADIDVDLDAGSELDLDFGEIQELPPEKLPHYEGEYEVTPTFADQTMETSGLLMEEDVKIEAIPVARVSNNAGGMTVIIGG